MSTKSRTKWLCLSCGIDTGKAHEHYMLKDKVWELVHNSPNGMYCIGCFESKLGRELSRIDFNDSYINDPHFAPMSMRLFDRLTK